MDPKKVGATIALLRGSRHMTQAELGEQIGVTFQAVSKWERGETLPDTALLPTLADALETSIDFILRGGKSNVAFKGKIKVADMIDGLNHLKKAGELLGNENSIYRCAIEGINQGMNTDIEAAFADDYMFEAFVTEAIIQHMMNGMYVDTADVMHSFKHEHFRKIVLAQAEKYAMG